MNDDFKAELIALTAKWRTRAKRFMADAEHVTRYAEVVRLTAMASTLEWAASDLSVYADSHEAL